MRSIGPNRRRTGASALCWIAGVAVLPSVACSTPPVEAPPAPPAGAAAIASSSARRSLPDLGAPRAPATADAAPGAADAGAEDAEEPARVEQVAVPGDRAVHVLWGAPGDPRVLVYLPGRCGDDLAFLSFAEAARRHGTLVGLLGDERCKGSSRFRWGASIGRIDARIRAAVRAVRAARGEPIDAEPSILIGYSEGASRAAALARAHPRRYARVVLAGLPKVPASDGLTAAEAVALVVGQRDRRRYIEEGARALASEGVRAGFFVLPGAAHGEYGPDGARVMAQVLAWVEAGGGRADAGAARANGISGGAHRD